MHGTTFLSTKSTQNKKNYNQCHNQLKHNNTYGRKSQPNGNIAINFQRNFHTLTNMDFLALRFFLEEKPQKNLRTRKVRPRLEVDCHNQDRLLKLYLDQKFP